MLKQLFSTSNKKKNSSTKLESYFSHFRKNIIGIDQEFVTPFGIQKIVYADWIASGRMYGPIEDLMRYEISPFVGNTHTDTTVTGSTMTKAYHRAKEIIKAHVNARKDDILISSNAGMTGVINKFQRILGLKVHEKYVNSVCFEESEKPIVFVTHMEHHSNQTTWLETICDVVVVPANAQGLFCLENFEKCIEQYKDRNLKIAAITACSNVTGIKAPIHKIARMIHAVDGYCFVDYACSAPYVDINMHPENTEERLDAIYYSPHKFLGGPSSSGILVFNSTLYNNRVPDNPGGGTVDWTNPWGEHKYYDEIEAREDGGTPSFLQTIRVALATQLKEQMGTKNIHLREKELLSKAFSRLKNIENLHILAENVEDRLGVISFYIDDLHYNLAVKMLNDRYGIQVRGGCSCAGTYGHFLLNVSKDHSNQITCKINEGDMSEKPGWVRLSIHPTMTDKELEFVLNAITDLSKNHVDWSKEYAYNTSINEFYYQKSPHQTTDRVESWFSTKL